jgi:hypothetical protein
LGTTNLALPPANWTSLATLTNTTGRTNFADSTPGLKQRYYMAQPLP